MIVLVFIDQLTKSLFTKIYQKNGVTTVIKDFFYFTYVENTGAAWSFLSDVSWAQLFFKSLTIVSLIIKFVQQVLVWLELEKIQIISIYILF